MAEVNLVGQTILGYTVDELLGAGTFGTVYKVSKNNASGHYVRALKHITIPTIKQYNAVLNSMGGDYSKADDYFARVLQDIINEIKILNSLSEKGAKGIVRYYENDIIETPSPKRYDIYILMEYLTPFTNYIEIEDFTVNDVINLGLGILSALKICHKNGIIHRDIKDDNIFVNNEKEYKLGDFGVSKILKNKSRAESMKGTPNFIAPEVYLGKESYTNSVDLYSLGIVLYKLLNYSRNPFLPPYPTVYDTSDEDRAFEERMKGAVPPLPLNGGTELGQIIIKAISSKETRYIDAEEFYNDLLQVKNTLVSEKLNQKVNIIVPNNNKVNSIFEQVIPQKYEETIGECYNNDIPISSQNKDSTNRDIINKNLFETIGESIFEKAYSSGLKDTSAGDKSALNSSRNNNIADQVMDNTRPTNINEPIRRQEVKGIEKRDLIWIVYFLPVIIAFIGVIIYSFIIPSIYGKTVSFIDWLFSDPSKIINTFRNPNHVLPKVYNIIFLRILMYVLSGVFITSLFFVGKQLHKKKEPDNLNAILKGKEPYFYVMKISGALREAGSYIKSSNISQVKNRIKILEEKFKNESDFGSSNQTVTDCENEIARVLYDLFDAVKTLKCDEKLCEYQSKIENIIIKVQELLKQRSEMKRR